MSEMLDYKSLNDEDLFAIVKDKDKDAFKVLFDRFSKRLFAYFLKASATREIAEDNFQVVLLQILEKQEQFTGGNFMAWVMTIARNRVLQEHRVRKQVDENFDMELQLQYEDNEGADENVKYYLNKCMQKLPIDFKEVMMLRYFQELSFKEIADELKISEESARVKSHRAKKMLHDCMTPNKHLLY